MTKTLIGIAIFLLVVILFVLVAIFSFVRRTVKKVRKTVFGGQDGGEDYSRRKSQQYHFDERRSSGNGNGQGNGQSRRTQTSSGEVIIDNRHPEQSGRKIFNDDDGEYVDYTEVHNS